MVDRRELILARIFAVMQGVKSIANIERMPTDLPEFLRLGSYLALIDGDEDRPVSNIEVVGMMPGMMEMTPIIVGGLSAAQESLGPGLSAIRAALVKALLSDVALQTAITGRENMRYSAATGSIGYKGLNGKLSRGSLMAADMQLNFSIRYAFNPNEL